MRRHSPVESPPNQPSVIHPILQAVLNSLDIRLDDELARYRRLKPQQKLAPPRNRSVRPAAAANPLPSLSTAAPAARLSIAPSQPHTPTQRALPELEFAANDSANLMSLQARSPQTEDAIAANPDHVHPDDYLESSEELLRGLAEEEADLRAEQEPGLLATLLTPLGIGSMLLLLLSSATFGYVIMNPTSLEFLGLEHLFNTPDPSEEIATSDELMEGAQPPNAPGPDLAADEFVNIDLDTLSSLPSGEPLDSSANPDAASSSPAPTDMATPAALAESETSSASTPVQESPAAPAPSARPQRSVAPSPVASRSAAPARPAAQPPAARPAPQRSPATAASASAPQPSRSAPVAVAAAPSPAPANLYYVVASYSGDRSLEEARQAVGDAYVRNFPGGAKVQFGAFQDESGARELMQNLNQQGISAQIYQP